MLKQQALAAIAALPPFSPILSRLMASLNGEEVSFAALGDLIEKDAVLTGRLLGVVNSALYARRTTINSVRHALAILGVQKVRNTLLGISISSLLNQARTPPSWSMARFNRHSAAVAVLSDLIAARSPVEYPEGAFVAGLLHDMGRLLIAIGLPREFHSILRDCQASGRSWVECEQQTLGFLHPELSSAALAVWKVPEPIQRAAAEHHAPPAPEPGAPVSLGCVVCFADRYINSRGETILPSRKPDAADPASVEVPGMEQEAVAALLADFEAEYAAIAQYFR